MTSLKSGLLNFYHFLSLDDVSLDLKDPYQTLGYYSVLDDMIKLSFLNA